MIFLKLKNSLLMVALMSIQPLLAQDYDLDKVSEAELEMKVYAKDSLAPAVYLNKIRETYFDYTDKDGFIIINKFTERIKILKKSGLNYATKKIGSYKNEDDKEYVSDVWGKTYNLEDDKILEDKLEESAIFERVVSDDFNETAFTMPNAQVGSIVEWGYKTISPFWKIDDLIFQEDIPVSVYHATIKTPGPFAFRRIKRGYFEIQPEERVERRSLGVNYNVKTSYGTSSQNSRNAQMSFAEIITEYYKIDIPALKDESHVDNIRNYRMSIVYELVSTEFNEGNKIEYATTWEEVAKSIFKHENFGAQLENTNFLNEVANSIRENHVTEEDRIDAVLNFVKNNLTWNGDDRLFVENDLKRVFKEGSGNTAEVNLTLVALLRACGIYANPVVLSTKAHGIPLFPTREGFNYVVAGLRRDKKNILIDATDKYASLNILPKRIYNWSGRMINKEGISQEIDLLKTIAPSSNTYVKGRLDEDGLLTGEYKQRLASIEALDFRHLYASREAREWERYQVEQLGLSSIENYSVDGLKDLDKPLVVSFNFSTDQAVEQVGTKVFLSPLSFLKMTENPFKSDERQFPISFDYPYSKDIIFNIQLQDNYKVASLPDSVNLALPDEAGSFMYSIAENNGALQVVIRYKLNKSTIAADYYLALKEFYKIRIEKENEKVVLEKI